MSDETARAGSQARDAHLGARTGEASANSSASASAAGAQADASRMDAQRDAAYWPRLAQCLMQLCRARSALVVREAPDGSWQVLASALPPDGVNIFIF